ncbi:class I SAM-dependent methyltransferase [Kitasatospora aburaviensis]
MSSGERPELGEVPETALWTLWYRAVEARRPDAVLHDPKAVELVDRIDFPFADRFGTSGTQAQLQALRASCFDREVADFLDREPRGTVVSLGEGLETQYWRVDNGRARWLGVDLPEAVALRERLLPPGPRRRHLAADATDLSWADEVDHSRAVLISAQGLLMYLPPMQVRALIAGCAERLPGATFLLDAVPRWFSHLTLTGRMRSHAYQPRPCPGRWTRTSAASSAPRARRWPRSATSGRPVDAVWSARCCRSRSPSRRSPPAAPPSSRWSSPRGDAGRAPTGPGRSA